MKPDYEIESFANEQLWRQWLHYHHADTQGLWLRLYKKASGVDTVTYQQALEHALCYGWIDGQSKRFDELSFLQKFTPRRKASLWSKRNIDIVAQLIDSGLMMPSGFAEIERAKNDGRWNAAYDRPVDMVVPDFFLAALHDRPKASKRFETLNKTQRYSIAWKLQTAKTDVTRARRLEALLVELEKDQNV